MKLRVLLLMFIGGLFLFSACDVKEAAYDDKGKSTVVSEISMSKESSTNKLEDSTTKESSTLSTKETTTNSVKETTTTVSTSKEEKEEKDMNVQSELMLEYTGKKWSKELEEELKDVDFASFAFDIDNPVFISDVDNLFVLANKANRFSDEFKPQNLVNPKSRHSGSPSRRKLRVVAANAIDELISAAKAEGIEIRTVSAYRTIDYQKTLFDAYASRSSEAEANQYSSRAGHSEHHTGLCVDVSSPSVNYDLKFAYGDTIEGKWIARNAHKYGYVVRYPKDKHRLTGYLYEPWHLRYFGVPLATYLYETELTYEEFIALQVGKMPEDIMIEWIDFD